MRMVNIPQGLTDRFSSTQLTASHSVRDDLAEFTLLACVALSLPALSLTKCRNEPCGVLQNFQCGTERRTVRLRSPHRIRTLEH
jgi:hypothetical protein